MESESESAANDKMFFIVTILKDVSSYFPGKLQTLLQWIPGKLWILWNPEMNLIKDHIYDVLAIYIVFFMYLKLDIY